MIDAAHLAHQREWSLATFGPGRRTYGVIDHIRKELDEIAAAPQDVEECGYTLADDLSGRLEPTPRSADVPCPSCQWAHGEEPEVRRDAI